MNNLQKTVLQLDKIKTKIPIGKFEITKPIQDVGYLQGLNYKLDDNGFCFEISSKSCATANSLGAITKDISIAEKVCNICGVRIDETYLINEAFIFRADVFSDVKVDEKPFNYIAEMREVLKSKSDKYDIYKYDDVGYSHGLVIVPKTQKSLRFIAYNKRKELMKSRNRLFCEQFSYDFLQEINQIIRFECQYRSFNDMRKAFNLSIEDKPTLANIFECKRNVVGDVFNELLTV